MALKSTIFKINLAIADLNRNYYEDHILTIARHPSETDQRMLLRLIVFALNANEQLRLGKGLGSAEEPDLWQFDLTGQIEHWIDLGQPAEKRIRQSCGKAQKVSIYTYQRGDTSPWFEDLKGSLVRFKHLSVVQLTISDDSMVAQLIDRTMNLSCTIESDQIFLANSSHNLTVELRVLKAADR